jgi:DNA mismatch endonuclease Vsr
LIGLAMYNKHTVVSLGPRQLSWNWDPVDTLTREERSARMARIRGKDTKPEMVVRRTLHRLGYRYRLHRRDLPGRPDIIFPARKVVLFVHGCFWHAHANCKVANLPKSRREYWIAKFARNKDRDERNANLLAQAGWRVMTVWECETKDLPGLERLLDCKLRATGAVAERTGAHGRK